MVKKDKNQYMKENSKEKSYEKKKMNERTNLRIKRKY